MYVNVSCEDNKMTKTLRKITNINGSKQNFSMLTQPPRGLWCNPVTMPNTHAFAAATITANILTFTFTLLVACLLHQ